MSDHFLSRSDFETDVDYQKYGEAVLRELNCDLRFQWLINIRNGSATRMERSKAEPKKLSKSS